MRKFESIYKELQFYESFTNNPLTLKEALKSTSAYFAEVEIDLREKHYYDIKLFDFFIVCQNLQTEKWMRERQNKEIKNLKFKPFLDYLKQIHKEFSEIYS